MKTGIRLLSVCILALNLKISAQSSGSWTKIDSLNEARNEPGSVVLPNGNVLIGGGEGINSFLASCEIYEITTGKWRYTKPLIVPLLYGDFILLKTGKILSIGGYQERSCELFDPNTETWTMTDSLPTMRAFAQSTTVLMDGRILVCGGFRYSNDFTSIVYLPTCDIYDPVNGKWSRAAPMNIPRYSHSATLLEDGKVLVAGGFGASLELRSCEIYDPIANTWTITTSLNEARSEAASILLPNGNVFISGGDSLGAPWKNTCEVFDVLGKKWSYAGSMHDARIAHQIYSMSNEKQLMIIGGAIGQGSTEDTWETYDPINLKTMQYGIFPINKMFSRRSIVKLSDDGIIIAGGQDYAFSASDGMPYAWFSKSCLLFDLITSVEEPKLITNNYFLFQNYPNPFNPTTKIKYSLLKSGYTLLEVYNSLGQIVRTLVHSYQNVGSYQIQFNAKELPSGIYFYRLCSGAYSKTNKMLLIK